MRRLTLIILAVALSAVVAGSFAYGMMAGVWFKQPTATGNQPQERKIFVTYSYSYAPSLANNVEPKNGNKFLVMTVTVENRGYESFEVDPYRDIYVTIKGERYDTDVSADLFFQPFPAATITNGHSISGKVVLQVPVDAADTFEPHWISSTAYTIVFNRQA